MIVRRGQKTPRDPPARSSLVKELTVMTVAIKSIVAIHVVDPAVGSNDISIVERPEFGNYHEVIMK